MANLAVLASGNGSNFQAIAERIAGEPHRLCCLICDKAAAYALERARRLGIPPYVVGYAGRNRQEAEEQVIQILRRHDIDVVALAGFMRLLTPLLVDEYEGRIVNIHPSLLPKYPGMNAIAQSHASSDREVGITVHIVDHGMDSGPILVQRRIEHNAEESLEELEQRIHALEHSTYPEVILRVLDEVEDGQHAYRQNARRMQ